MKSTKLGNPKEAQLCLTQMFTEIYGFPKVLTKAEKPKLWGELFKTGLDFILVFWPNKLSKLFKKYYDCCMEFEKYR